MLRRLFVVLAPVVLITLLVSSPGLALPVSNCVNMGPATGSTEFTCSLYPSTIAGNPSPSGFVTFATYGIADPSPGFLILLDPGDAFTEANETNMADWDEVVSWSDVGSVGETQPGDGYSIQAILCDQPSCFPTFAQVFSGAPGSGTNIDPSIVLSAVDPNILTEFEDMTASGVFYYPQDDLSPFPTNSYYVIYTPAAAAIPEPASICLVLLGVSGLLLARFRLSRPNSSGV